MGLVAATVAAQERAELVHFVRLADQDPPVRRRGDAVATGSSGGDGDLLASRQVDHRQFRARGQTSLGLDGVADKTAGPRRQQADGRILHDFAGRRVDGL